MKKDKVTFAEKLMAIIIILVILFTIVNMILLIIVYDKANWPIKITATMLVLLITFSLVILILKCVIAPFLDYKKLLKRFINGQTYQELIERAGYIIPEMGGVLLRFDNLLNNLKTQQEIKKQSEFLALQNQINPHFLYNTLEAIRGDALSEGRNNIADIVEALSTFFRYTVTETGNLVTLADELDNVDNYFRIQQYRFGEKLNIVYEISDLEDEVLKLQCPKLTIQPIIENAIFHGLEKKAESGTVRIGIELTNNKVLINIKDDGVGIEEEVLDVINKKLENVAKAYIVEEKNKKGGIALNNVCRRIKLLFGEEYGVHVYSLLGVGTDVSITLPIMRKE